MGVKKQSSPVVRLLDIVWSSTNAATSHSWERLNHAMYGALKLAIGAGFKFEPSDVAHVMEHYRSGYWIGDSESIYSYAIASDNLSAVNSFESWRGRKPFMADVVDRHGRNDSFRHGGGGVVQKSRLAVGFSFRWNGQPVKVTSFAKDQLSFTACSYKKRKKGEYGDNIDNRYSVTHEELLQGRAYDRERKTLLERTRLAPDEARAAIVKALRLKCDADWSTLPIEKARKIVDKYAPMAPRIQAPRCKSVTITQDHIDRLYSAASGSHWRPGFRNIRPGMRSSRIRGEHRQWLLDNHPVLAAALGFGAILARDALLETARSMRGEATP